MGNLTKFSINGAKRILDKAKLDLNSAISKHPQKNSSYPDCDFELPIIYSFFDKEINQIEDLKEILDPLEIKEEDSLENAMNSGLTSAIAAEVIESLKYIEGNPYEAPYTGFIPDNTIREISVYLANGEIPGIAIVVGNCEKREDAIKIINGLQEKEILVFLVGGVIEQIQEDVKFGVDKRIIPLGGDITSVIHAFNIAVRIGLIFGGVKRGQAEIMQKYIKEKVSAFILALGELNGEATSLLFAAKNFDFPVITDQSVEENTGIISEPNKELIVNKCLEKADIKVKNLEMDIPINYGFSYLGERVRKEDMFFEAGGTKSKSFLLVKSTDSYNVEDHKITIVGKDIDDTTNGKSILLGLKISVSGNKMQEDFEPIIEGYVEDFINSGKGLWCVGKRTYIWIRITGEAYKNGFRLKHLGEILYSNIKLEFGNIVDKVSVTIITDESSITDEIEKAKKVYDERDKRTEGMTDESVNEFYTCLLCQSFAPDHICIISPERTGLCGAVSWLDAKAGYQINPAKKNQPIFIKEPTDPIKGTFDEINKAVLEESHGTIEKINMYSLMEDPMTSCGCFESILTIIPELNGVMIVDRDFHGMTPIGMKFSTLAGSVGGGVQTPGFMGISKKYIFSKKFLLAEGGIKRIVWMTTNLKNFLSSNENIDKKLLEQIADETTAENVEQIKEHITKHNHPVLSMDELM